jgi:cell wall-associated NlpC family hydrolase
MRYLRVAFFFALVLYCGVIAAQAPLNIRLQRGASASQVGIENDPNRDCSGPKAIGVSESGQIYLLDSVNHRVLRFSTDGTGYTPFELPAEVVSANDLLPVASGFFLLANRATRLLALDQTGNSKVSKDVIGNGRDQSRSTLGISADGFVAVIAPDGEVTLQSVVASSLGVTFPSIAPDYITKRSGENSIAMERKATSGPIRIFINGPRRITASVLSVIAPVHITKRSGGNSIEMERKATSGPIRIFINGPRRITASVLSVIAPVHITKRSGGNSIEMERKATSGPIRIFINGPRRITYASVLSVDSAGRAYVQVEEFVHLPKPRFFIKIVRTDKDGRMEREAYLPDMPLPCMPNRSVAISQSGKVLSLKFDNEGADIQEIVVGPLGQQLPASKDTSELAPISNSVDMSGTMESLNGTTSAGATSAEEIGSSVLPITRDEILRRAVALAELRWVPKQNNLSHEGITSNCVPQQGQIWLQPKYLNNKSEEVKGAPYRWGGYHPSLESYLQQLQEGRLAGNICTCRHANLNYCRFPEAVGWDCSGFVSYAWKIDYLTTVDLLSVATLIDWDDLQAGDIVVRPGYHAALVMHDEPSRRALKVIHATVACGRVCKETLLVGKLRKQGYLPLRRRNLS